ncbi:MAG: hypothetical protein JWM16_2319 [Verrucomicrobiales bacterium]|nr:hypothetical protein [Verrucomicrobiales bacterium]
MNSAEYQRLARRSTRRLEEVFSHDALTFPARQAPTCASMDRRCRRGNAGGLGRALPMRRVRLQSNRRAFGVRGSARPGGSPFPRGEQRGLFTNRQPRFVVGISGFDPLAHAAKIERGHEMRGPELYVPVPGDVRSRNRLLATQPCIEGHARKQFSNFNPDARSGWAYLTSLREDTNRPRLPPTNSREVVGKPWGLQRSTAFVPESGLQGVSKNVSNGVLAVPVLVRRC